MTHLLGETVHERISMKEQMKLLYMLVYNESGCLMSSMGRNYLF